MTGYGPVALPTLFTDDHFGRIEVEGCGEVEVVSEGARIVKLTFKNLASLHDYATDARYYCDEGIAQDMRESGCGNISKSAARALERIEAAGLLDVALSSEAAAEYERLAVVQREKDKAWREEAKALFAARRQEGNE